MILVLKNNNIFSIHNDNTDTQTLMNAYDISYSFCCVPVLEDVLHVYKNAGFNIDIGLIGLPSPLSLDLNENILFGIRAKTAAFNRKINENIGIVWSDIQFKTDTKTCQSLFVAIHSIKAGLLQEPLSWRGENGFIDLTLNQLEEVALIVIQKTEQQFINEKEQVSTRIPTNYSAVS